MTIKPMGTKSIRILLTTLVLASATGVTTGQRPTHEGKVALFGNLHAHSKLSDDISGAGNEMLPRKAFESAHAHGLDFLAISDHHKATDSSHRLWMTEVEWQNELLRVARDYNSINEGKFIAIPAIEWGNTATGNHVNVFGAKDLPPNSIKDADYDELFTWAAENAEFIQLNHPYSWHWKSNRNQTVGNFGRSLYKDDVEYVGRAGKTFRTMSIICTVAGGHISGAFSKNTNKTHRDAHPKHYGEYLRYLNMGFKLSPAANQDTHGTNWGTVTAARTAVWADSPSYTDLMKAVRAGRVYATEDDEMAVVFQVKHHGGKSWMGETVKLTDEESEVAVLVRVWQAVGTDGDQTDEGPYRVDIFSDYDGIGGRQAALWSTHENLSARTEHEIPLSVVAGEYIFIRVTEQNGKDNPVGDGEDVFDNQTDEYGQDGNRDDMNDSAWTTPVWFEFTTTTFVWTKNSSKWYHDPNCWAVQQIGSANRRQGTTPPANRQKHDCHP